MTRPRLGEKGHGRAVEPRAARERGRERLDPGPERGVREELPRGAQRRGRSRVAREPSEQGGAGRGFCYSHGRVAAFAVTLAFASERVNRMEIGAHAGGSSRR